jgi:hypothetical protein
MALEDVIEQGVTDAERCVEESRLWDYAWMADQAEIARGRAPHHFDELIDRQYAAFVKEFYGDGHRTDS